MSLAYTTDHCAKQVSNALCRSTKQENIFVFFFKTYLDIRVFKINKLSVVLWWGLKPNCCDENKFS